ncbi:MAG TPA: PaaX family transcriptional regulator C-terminal domain-containing protein [Trebonia sp.]
MKARSLVFDFFGDYLRYRGGEVRLRQLITLLGYLAVPEPTARVAAARMRKEGWLTARKEGREIVLALTQAAWDTLDEGRMRIFHRASGPWDGQWHMVIYQVTESERALREQLRKRLAWLGFGPLTSSVWVSPHDLTDLVRSEFSAHPAVRLDVFHSRSEGAAADQAIAVRAWELPTLDVDYRALLSRYRPRLPLYRASGLDSRDALAERMRLIHDYRQFPFRDPDLPPELLPEGWHGRQAHEVFLTAHGLLRAAAERAVDDVVGDAPRGLQTD